MLIQRLCSLLWALLAGSIDTDTAILDSADYEAEMLMLDRLARQCANIQLPSLGAHISRARNCTSSASKRLVASVPEDRLQQAQRAMEALGNLQPQQQTGAATAVSGTIS